MRFLRRKQEAIFWLTFLIVPTFLVMWFVSTHTKPEPAIATRTVVHERVLLATNKQIANLFINQLLTPKSAACFRAILMKESHMRTGAVNDQTGAKGMGQILASTYRNLGLLHSADPLAQSVAALAYISRHYGGANSTCNAWAYWRSHSSY